jgi:hypothetical protein
MSTGLECLILQVETNRWYYILEDWGAPKGAWDWRENAGAYGPFTTAAAAKEHLRRFQANPGSYSIDALPTGVDRLHYDDPNHPDYDQVLANLVCKAPRHTRRI